MIVNKGLFDGIVLQRVRNASDADISGLAENAGTVMVKVTDSSGKAIRGFASKKIGKATKGRFTAHLKGLPAGGPYVVSMSIDDESLVVKDVYVGDVWMLGGQSNMQGYGLLTPALKPDKMVRAFYSDDTWGTAVDPIHILHKAVDSVHAALGAGENPKQGPAIAFGQEMYKQTGVPQGLIASAHGGTTMQQWSPSLKKLKGASLYGATLRRFEKNGGKIAGFLWYQGCSDANQEDAKKYTDRMKALVKAFRKDLKNPKLPFVLVQIAKVIQPENATTRSWNSIQEQQRLLPGKIKNCLTVPAIDLPLDDIIHIGGKGLHILGRRLADAMLVFTGKSAGRKKPIELDKIRLLNDKSGMGKIVEVSFKNVVGELQSAGVPSGFAFADANGRKSEEIYKIELRKNKAILYSSNISCDGFLHYGLGFSPYCNITDSAGRSLPVFGPICSPLQNNAYTGFAMDYMISSIIPFAGKPTTMPLPSIDDKSLGWETRHFEGGWFGDRHLELNKADKHICYFVTDMICDEDMRGKLLVGYDGPLKVWLDGKLIINDKDGTNPCIPDKACKKVSLKKKQHRVVVALHANGGKAWGICLRFARMGLSKAKLMKGPEHYSLPKFAAPEMKKNKR